jgi:chromosome segregation ATPase
MQKNSIKSSEQKLQRLNKRIEEKEAELNGLLVQCIHYTKILKDLQSKEKKILKSQAEGRRKIMEYGGRPRFTKL